MKAISFMRDIFGRYRAYLAANIALIFTESIFEGLSLFSLVPLIDFLIKPDLSGASFVTRKLVEIFALLHIPATLVTILALFMVLNILRVVFTVISRYLMLRTKYAVLYDILVGTYEDFFNARWYFFSSNKQGVLLSTFMREIDIVGNAFSAMAQFFAGILRMGFYLAVPLCLSWQVTSATLLTALLLSWPFARLGRGNYRLGQLNTATANRVGSVIQENLSSAKIILGFGNQHKSVNALRDAYEQHRKVTLKAQTLGNFPLLHYPFGMVILAMGMLLAKRYMLPISEIAVLFYALLKVIPTIGELTAQKNSLDNFFPSYEQVLNLRERARDLVQRAGGRKFEGFRKEVIVNDLSFAYPDHEPTITDIRLRIPKGKMIAFVGESGAGKSTLIDMLMGFHEPMAGLITIDGVPLQEYDVNSYRRHIGYVPQDSVLFNMSIRDNLLWAFEAATQTEIEHACKLANAGEFIQRFPNRYDTIVGDRGVRLSGGQIQRIALARAILRKPDILILDEATSALDTNSERLIQEAIEKIAKETTVIVIAHRLSTIVNADHVYVLHRGRIIEEGTYAQLIGKSGEFNRMIQQQRLEAVK